ncbi:MAG: flagellar type III secretion system protein FlhB [Burkholderiaceae bacterium]
MPAPIDVSVPFAMADAQNRHLPASARRIERARSEGQVARSRDLAHLLPMAAGALALALAAAPAARWATALLAGGLRFDARALAGTDPMLQRLAGQGLQMLLVLVPAGVLLLAASLAAAVLAGGWNFTWKPLTPSLNKLDPLAGVVRLASSAHLIDTVKAVLLAVVLGAVGVWAFGARVPAFHDALTMPLPTALAHTGEQLLSGMALLLGALAVFAAVDVPLQRHLFLQRLRMSRDEAKQELKELEGNLEIKGKIKARMREIVQRRMMAEVPKADLVVMNPEHYAVALKYDEATMAAPRVVAKGADLLALRIRDIARDAKVPVLRLPPLARALYAHVEIDREVPAALFAAVAQVLAYVYQLRAALAGRSPMPAAVPDIALPAGLDPHEGRPRAGGEA